MARKMITMEGNQAAAHVSYAYTEVATIYPITPSSNMPEYVDEWAAEGRKNIFGQSVLVTELQSEAGAAAAVHGSLAAGALTTTYSASQGLLLMIPTLYKVAGEQLPGVFHISARAVASHALSIFGDHSDVYACRQTGVAMLCESSVQEVMDLGPVAHCAAMKGKVPFISFFDGFRTSHEMQKIEAWDYEDLDDLMDKEAVAAFRAGALNPNHPVHMGSAQNPDTFFQAREASNSTYDALPAIVKEYMDKVNAKIGTDYRFFNYHGAPDADRIIIAMGSVCETIDETVDYLLAAGEKVGVVKVRLYRPFVAQALIDEIPDTVKTITVLDRTKEPGALGEPLYLDVVAALKDSKFHNVPILSGRYGLGSKETNSAQMVAVFKNTEKKKFTVGIVDDVTNLSLEVGEHLVTTPVGTRNCKFWGLGGDGTVGANQNSIRIIGDNTDMYAQGYFEFDSKKSGGVTISHLRFGKSRIKSTYLIRRADFVACHKPSYVTKYNMVQEVVKGGTFLLNCPWDKEALETHLPGQVKSYIANNDIQFYTIDATKIGYEIGLGNRVNTVLQSAFFKLADIIPSEQAIAYMKETAKETYGRRGEDVVLMNYAAIDAGATQLHKVEVPESWKQALDEGLDQPKIGCGDCKKVVSFVENVQTMVNTQRGNELPVSKFMDYVDGSTPSGTSAYEKRGIAVNVPVWQADDCIQCNQCSYVCPHAVIRPVVLDDEEAAKAPAGMVMKDMNGMPGLKYSLTLSALDCSGCGVCVDICPVNKNQKNDKQALTLAGLEERLGDQEYFDYGITIPTKPEVLDKFKETTVKGSQFKKPLLEFSGACAGCGETPYVKLITQLFGERMYIGNATGCSSIWGNSSPSTPYTVNEKGQGPAWCNSLFEDTAEFSYGMLLGHEIIRARMKGHVEKIVEMACNDAVVAAGKAYLDTFLDGSASEKATEELLAALEACDCDTFEKKELLEKRDFLSKKSIWAFGGDGWAYDIGFGGLDHVISTGLDVNMLVMDTEVYSNTGGQASKATPLGSTAQFAAAGKDVKKKDLASICMSYGYVYVAQIGMGADYNQTIKAIVEAEAYPGPSVIIAYSPCIAHGIPGGMAKSMEETIRAIESGYWHNFRFNPMLESNKFILDSKEPTGDLKQFIESEGRYAALMRTKPEKAEALFVQAAKDAKERYKHLERLVKLYE